MKRLLFLLTIITIPFVSSGQLFKKKESQIIKERIERNFDYLSKSNLYVKGTFRLDEKGIQVIGTNAIEYYLPYNYVNEFIDAVKSMDLYEQKRAYLKGNFIPPPHAEIKEKEIFKVALDPGHMSEAFLEERYVKYQFEGVDTVTLIKESNLNLDVCWILSEMLKEEGIEVLLSRETDKSAVGVDFEDWIQGGNYKEDLEELVESEEFTWGRAIGLLEDADTSVYFDEIYTFVDFKRRAQKINAFRPDLTVTVHFNASEESTRDENGFSTLSEEDYSMIFVPGAFMLGELKKVDQKIDFLRLLVSDNIEKSIQLSLNIRDAIEVNMGVPPHNQSMVYSDMIQYNTVSTEYDGIYSRNLYMSRAIESPISYTEVLVQNTKEELIALSKQDYTYKGRKVSYRLYLSALSLKQGIMEYLKTSE